MIFWEEVNKQTMIFVNEILIHMREEEKTSFDYQSVIDWRKRRTNCIKTCLRRLLLVCCLFLRSTCLILKVDSNSISDQHLIDEKHATNCINEAWIFGISQFFHDLCCNNQCILCEKTVLSICCLSDEVKYKSCSKQSSV